MFMTACVGASTPPDKLGTAMNLNLPSPELAIPGATCTDLTAPKLRHAAHPDYPPEVREDRVSGRVVLRLHVLSDGSVREVQVISSPDDRLTPGALRVARGAKFKPALCNGTPVEVFQYHVFTYTLM